MYIYIKILVSGINIKAGILHNFVDIVFKSVGLAFFFVRLADFSPLEK